MEGKMERNIEFRKVGDIKVPAIINGLWQVSGAHGTIKPESVSEMFAYVDAGLTAFDAADHYGPAELFLGEFRKLWIEREKKKRC